MHATTIYILKCKYGKYYVGKTGDVVNRIFAHFVQDAANKASVWTSKYSPISIEEIIENCDDFDEDKYTKVYMSKYGIQNVRGGSYTKTTLAEEEIDHLLTELRGARNACYYCGSDAHYINDCTKLYMSQKKVKPITYVQHKTTYKQTYTPTYKQAKCYRCGRPGHIQTHCYAKMHIDGYYISLTNEKKPAPLKQT